MKNPNRDPFPGTGTRLTTLDSVVQHNAVLKVSLNHEYCSATLNK